MMTTNKNPTGPIDEQVCTLLERYKCPAPFHEVRTRFLGNIAAPVVSAFPIKVLEDLWDGELPAFDSIDDANALIGALIMDLWNRLTRHKDRNSPFRLMRIDSPATREGIAALALMRRQELDGFIEGIFGQKDSVDVPERAHRGLDVLGELRALFAVAVEIATDETKAATGKELETTLRHMRYMTKDAEHEIHAIL
jgi:hypothetical protein